MSALYHVKSNTVADFTGTVTGFNSQGSTTTLAATNLVRPGDWNSAHRMNGTVSGNTAGQSTYSGVTNVVYQGGNNVTLSVATAASVATVVISAGNGTQSRYHPYADRLMVVGQQGQGTLCLDPDFIPNITFDRIQIPMNYTATSNQSGSITISMHVGIYSKNGSTLSLMHSTSQTHGITNSGTAGNYSLNSGMRNLTIPWSSSVSEGQYWYGVLSRTTTGGTAGMSMSQLLVSNIGTNYVGYFGQSHNTTYQMLLGKGVHSATQSTLPSSIAFSHVRGSDSIAQRAPVINFALGTA